MRKLLATLALLLLASAAQAQNYLMDNGIFTSVVTNTTNGQVLQNQSGILGGVSATITVNGAACTLGSSCTPGAGAIAVGDSVTGGISNGLFYNNANTLGNLATANNGVLVTSAGGVPSISVTLPTGLSAPSFTVTTAFTATGLVTNADLANPATTVNGQTCTLGSTCTVTAAPSGSAGGDLTGTYPNPTLAGVITAGGPTGSATVTPIITYDAKGRLTTVTSATITPAIGSVTGLGTGIASALGTNVGTAGAPVINGGALGTPSGGTGTNITGLVYTALPALSANQLLGALTATTPSGQSVPSCSTAASALQWTSGTGFGCNSSITANAVPAANLTGSALAAGVTASSLTSLGTITTLTATTINAFTLGGTIAGGGNNLNNIIIGATTPLAGSFTTLKASGNVGFTLETNPQTNLVISNNTKTGLPVAANAMLSIVGADTAVAGLSIETYGTATGPVFRFRNAGGTGLSPSATTGGSIIGAFGALGYANGAFTTLNAAGIFFFANNTWTASDNSTYVSIGTTPSGTTSRAEAARFNPSGGLSVGTTTDPGIGSLQLNAQMFMPSITTSSVAQTGTVCWTTGTGKFTVDTTVGCLTSIMAAKNITEHLSPRNALDIVSRLDPFAFRYKKGWGDSGQYEQFGFGAEEVMRVDERLVGRDPEGKLSGVRYQEMTAVLAGAIQQLQLEVQQLKRGIQ